MVMTYKTYEELTRDFFGHYNNKEYAAALDLLVKEADQFPEMAALTTFNKICMLSVQNCVPEALALFREAGKRGYFYVAKMLREDADLAVLQGNPDFEQLFGEFKARFETAQAQSTPDRIVIEPPSTATAPHPLLLALHGNSNNAARSRRFWEPAAKAGWLTAVLQSSQLGMTNGAYVWNDEAKSTHEIEQHRVELDSPYSIDPKRVVIGGFSAGGRIAASIGLTQPFAVRGFIGVDAYLAEKLDTWKELIRAAREHGTRVYLIIGDQDEGSYSDIVRFADLLKEN